MQVNRYIVSVTTWAAYANFLGNSCGFVQPLCVHVVINCGVMQVYVQQCCVQCKSIIIIAFFNIQVRVYSCGR